MFKCVQKIIIFLVYIFQFTLKLQAQQKIEISREFLPNFAVSETNSWSITSNSFNTSKIQSCFNGNVFGIFGSQSTISKTYTNLPKHYSVIISVTLFIQGSFDNEYVQMQFDSAVVYQQYYSLNSAPLGSFFGQLCPGLTYNDKGIPSNIGVQKTHNSSTLNLKFKSNVNEGYSNEGFGIQNLVVSVLACHSSCLECDGPESTDCTSCPPNSNQIGSICTCNTGLVAHENQCISSCPSGFVNQNNSGVCIDECPVKNCQSCTNFQCTQCNPGFKAILGQCHETCPFYTSTQSNSCTDSDFENMNRKQLLSMEFTEDFFTHADIINSGWTLIPQFREYNSIPYSSLAGTSVKCQGKVMALGNGINISQCPSTGCEFYKTFQTPELHFKIHIKILLLMGDSWDLPNDRVEFYIDNNKIQTEQARQGTQNLCDQGAGNAYADFSKGITLSVNHNSPTVEFKVKWFAFENTWDEWIGLREFQIISELCPESCTACSDFNTCTSCIGSTGLETSRQISSQCSCKNGQYSDLPTQNECLECGHNCYTCSNNLTCDIGCDNKCDGCSAGQSVCDECRENRINKPTCECPPHYYDTNQFECPECDDSCYTCSGTSTNCIISCDHKCTSCATGGSTCDTCRGNRLIETNCGCPIHFYESGQENCLECDDSCYTCSGTATNCIIPCEHQCSNCATGAQECDTCRGNRINDPTCICPNNFYEDGVSENCPQCGNTCYTCINAPNNCVIPCDNQCARCTAGKDICNECKGDRINSPTCQCPNNKYEDDVSEYCQQCSNECYTCEISADNCIISCDHQCAQCTVGRNICNNCKGNRINDPTCECPNNYYEDGVSENCPQCANECYTCENSANNCIISCDNQCAQCTEGKNICNTCKGDRLNPPTCNCPDHFYEDSISVNCLECEDTCQSCLITGCQICQANRIVNNLDNMECICPANGTNHYPESLYCSTCDTQVISSKLSENYLEIAITFVNDFEILDFLKDEMEFTNDLCIHLIESSTLSQLGTSPKCTQDSVNSLIIKFGFNPSLNIGDPINFNSSVIRILNNGCTSLETVQNFYLTNLKGNENPLEPVVSLSGPSAQISVCEVTDINISEMFNEGLRGLINIRWSIGVTDDDNTQNIDDYLQSASDNDQNFLKIQPRVLNTYKQYVFIVNFDNKFGQTGQNQIEINTGADSGIQVTIDQNALFQFYNFNTITFSSRFSYLDCRNGAIEEKNKVLNIVWEEINNGNTVTKKNFNSLATDRSSELEMLPYTHTALENYNVKITISTTDEEPQIQTFDTIMFEILKAKLNVFIQGGNRMSAYAQPLQILGTARDQNVEPERQEQDIIYQWSCLNVNTDGQCEQIDGMVLTFDNNSLEQNYPEKILAPYMAFQFELQAQKESDIEMSKAIIIVVETDLPVLKVSVPEIVTLGRVNQNDELQISIDYNGNPDNLFYSLVFIYEFEVVATKSYDFTQFVFTIWDLFSDFTLSQNELLVRVSVYDPRYFMPSQSTFSIMVNIPPTDCQLQFNQQQGNALSTEFMIQVQNCYDEDPPISYQYSFYSQESDYHEQSASGNTPTNSQQNILASFTSQNTLTTILPQGQYNPDTQKYENFFLVTVADQLGGFTNVTQTIEVNPFSNISEALNEIQQKHNIAMSKGLTQKINILNILSIQLYQLDKNGEHQNCNGNGSWSEEEQKCSCRQGFYLNDCSANKMIYDEYLDIKLSIFQEINELKNQIPEKLLQDQAVKSINLLLEGQGLVQKLSNQELLQLIEDMKILMQQKAEIIQQNISLMDQFNSGETTLSRKNQEANNLLGKLANFVDHLYQNIQYETDAPSDQRILQDTELSEQFNAVQNFQKDLQSNLQVGQLPNQDAIHYKGKYYQQTTQRNTEMKMRERFITTPEFQSIDDEEIDENNDSNQPGQQQQNNSQGDGENYKSEIYLTTSTSFHQNPYQKTEAFPYKDQSTKLYEVDIKKESENNSSDSEKIDLESSIVSYQFHTNNNSNPTCIQHQSSSSWGDVQQCYLQVISIENQEMRCHCNNLQPTTLINDINGIFKSSSINQTFTNDSLNMFIKFKFWNSFIFYLFLFKTIILFVAIKYGHKKDKEEFIQRRTIQYKIEQQLKKQPISEQIDQQQQQLQQPVIQPTKNNNLSKEININVHDINIEKNSEKNTHINSQNSIKISDSSSDDSPSPTSQNMAMQSSDRYKMKEFSNEKEMFQNYIGSHYLLKPRKKRKKLEGSILSPSALQVTNSTPPKSAQKYSASQSTFFTQNTTDIAVIGNTTNNSTNFISKKKLSKKQSKFLSELNKIEEISANQILPEETISQVNSPLPGKRKPTFLQKIEKNSKEQAKQSNDPEKQENQKSLFLLSLLSQGKSDQKEENKLYQQKQNLAETVLKIHQPIGIYYTYDYEVSRPMRYLLYYIKICLLISLTALFAQSMKNQTQNIVLAIIISIVSSLPIAILKRIFEFGIFSKIFGILLYISIILLSFYVAIVNASLMGIDQSNNWIHAYVISFLTDTFCFQILFGFAKLYLFNLSIGQQGILKYIRRFLAIDKGIDSHFQTDILTYKL